MILLCAQHGPGLFAQGMFLLVFLGVLAVGLLWLFAKIDEQVVKLFILPCLHLNSLDSTVYIAYYMNFATIGNIRIPETHRREVNWEEMVTIKNMPTDQPFCEVKIVQNQDKYYALKTIHKQQIPQDTFQEEYFRVENEIKALYALDHPNVVKLHLHRETEEDIMLLMQYGGIRIWNTLNKKHLSEEEVRDLTQQILFGLKQIHDSGFVHRDLSSDNILVNRQNHVKIADLGYANEIRGRRTKIGSLFYIAPEITGDDTYNHKADIWSLGVVVYQMLHQDIPFCSKVGFSQATFFQNRDKLRLNLKPTLSAEVIDFIKSMIALDPEKRLNVDELLKHPFIQPRREQSQHESESSFFDKLNQTQRIERKTQKNNLYIRQKSGRSEEHAMEHNTGIKFSEKDLKRSTNEIFACLHHQKDLLSELIKTYQDILEKEAIARVRNN